jgi:hypothetical protein
MILSKTNIFITLSVSKIRIKKQYSHAHIKVIALNQGHENLFFFTLCNLFTFFNTYYAELVFE